MKWTPFEIFLADFGLPNSRIANLACAFDNLHSALSKLDFASRRLFQKKTLEQWLMDYQKAEHVSDVIDIGKDAYSFEGRKRR